MEVWRSKQNCGQIQSLKQVLLLSVHQLHVSCLTVSNCVSLTQVPLTVSGFPRSLQCPLHCVSSKCVKCFVPASPWTVLCITSVPGGVCASSTLVLMRSIHHLELFTVHLSANFTFAMLFLMTKLHILPCLPVFCQNLADKMCACRDAPKVCHFVLKGHASSPVFQRSP